MNGVSIDEVWSAPSLLNESASTTRHSKYMKPIAAATPINQAVFNGNDVPVTYYDEDGGGGVAEQQPYMPYDTNYETFVAQEPSTPMPPPDRNMGGSNPQLHHELQHLRRAVHTLQSHIQYLRRQQHRYQQTQRSGSSSNHPFQPSVWVFLLLFVLLLIVLGIVLHLSTQQNKMMRLLFQHVSSNPLPAPSAPLFPSAQLPPPPPPPPLASQGMYGEGV